MQATLWWRRIYIQVHGDYPGEGWAQKSIDLRRSPRWQLRSPLGLRRGQEKELVGIVWLEVESEKLISLWQWLHNGVYSWQTNVIGQ